MRNKVLVIIGPTASGKSSLAIAVAKKIDGIVISADSMQIYKGLDIGTAKVSQKEAQGIQHELIDICEVNEKFDVSKYKNLCYSKIEEIFSQGKVPIICGGTGLYINSVVNNVEFDECKTSEKIQYELQNLEKTKNTEELYNYLYSIDPESAEVIDKNNARRILRAIELKLLGSSKIENDKKNNLWNANEKKYEFITIYIDIPRDLLYDRINKRVDSMVDDGILDEVQFLYQLEDRDNTACQAIGYKEFFDYLDGSKSLEECIEHLKINTRHYAKRQITWFKKLSDKITVDGTKEKAKLVEEILKEYYEV